VTTRCWAVRDSSCKCLCALGRSTLCLWARLCPYCSGPRIPAKSFWDRASSFWLRPSPLPRLSQSVLEIFHRLELERVQQRSFTLKGPCEKITLTAVAVRSRSCRVRYRSAFPLDHTSHRCIHNTPSGHLLLPHLSGTLAGLPRLRPNWPGYVASRLTTIGRFLSTGILIAPWILAVFDRRCGGRQTLRLGADLNRGSRQIVSLL